MGVLRLIKVRYFRGSNSLTSFSKTKLFAPSKVSEVVLHNSTFNELSPVSLDFSSDATMTQSSEFYR